ncbi:MAG TPA: hypothetical protein VE987_09200 [Polyangiaceae bacterium]|nr:hypothetical protein [Polyangiaceae bacterium]
MSSTTPKTKAAALARVQALVAGTKQHFPNGSFTLGNAAYTSESLVQKLQLLVDAMQKANAAEISAKDLRKAQRDTAAQVDPLIADYQRFLLAAFATATPTLADFGMQPPKARKPLPADKRAAATAKMRATRKARGTTSKKKKLAVKGDVTGVTVTPVTQPATASPTPLASSAPGAPPAPPK